MWQLDYELGSGCKIIHGYAVASEQMTTEPTEGPVVVNIGNFRYDGGFRFESTKIQKFVGEPPKGFILSPGDVLLVMTCQTPGGEILGIPGRIPDDGRVYLHNQRMGKLVITEPDHLDAGFLYYLFLSQPFNRHLYTTATGSKILHTAPKRIEAYRFSRPPLPTQRRIASILSAYDDLIENNTKRIKILEEMARALYREWFVHFRFPGHEKVELVESPIGQIPTGWRPRTLGDILILQRGFDLPKSERFDGSVPIVSSSGITGFHNESKVEAPAVITGRYGTLGDVFVILEDCWPLNTTLFVKDFKSHNPFYCAQLLETLDLARQNVAGAVPGVNRNVLHKMQVVAPPNDLIDEFGRHAELFYRARRNLERQNEVLEKQRDLLLPRLISGTLDVSTLSLPEST